jgi:NADH dehydrogenase [ubiquinone] 1 alpha subcomplex assembly factor 7
MMALKEKILSLIRASGPISLSDYMMLALYDSEHGYYTTRDPFGVAGDFTTAPEMSQMFGELVGAFLVQAWEDRGRPARFHLVELGPGRGTLMADILRAARVRPGFAEAARVTLIETSPVLRAAQAKTLEKEFTSPKMGSPTPRSGVGQGDIRWTTAIDEIPDDAPLFLVANEFFDALPIRQYVKATRGWHERRIGADGDKLVFALAPDPTPGPAGPDAPEGAVFETSPAARAIVTETATRIAHSGGMALIIDYGPAQPGLGDTFQAVKAHAYTDPLAEPGEADLTAHVDFAMLADAARAAGARAHGPVTQEAFLESLGIAARAAALSRAAPDQTADIKAVIDRLTGKEQMGWLFKVLALSDSTRPPSGFPC